MTQEIIATTIFVLAIFYGIFQLGKSLLPSKQKHNGGCGSSDCGCK